MNVEDNLVSVNVLSTTLLAREKPARLNTKYTRQYIWKQFGGVDH